MCEGTAEEAFGILSESGYGRGEAESARGFEALVSAEERALDGFIREYAPSEAEKAYFLAPRDFHNAKALVKASRLQADAGPLLAPEGLISVGTLSAALSSGDFSGLGKELSSALAEGKKRAEEGASGAEIGSIFGRAMFRRLASAVGKNGTLKKLLAGKADRANILTALRSPDVDAAEKQYAEGGRLTREQLRGLFAGDAEKAAAQPRRHPLRSLCGEVLCGEKRGAAPDGGGAGGGFLRDGIFRRKKVRTEKKSALPLLRAPQAGGKRKRAHRLCLPLCGHERGRNQKAPQGDVREGA